MGRSSGTGQPLWFKCPQCLGSCFGVKLTGKKRKLATGGYGRSDPFIREYVCSCGHIGWSRHRDLARWSGE